MAKEESQSSSGEQVGQLSLFIEGWLTTEFERGNRPIYGEPVSRLPEVNPGSMEVVTGYMAGK